MEGTIQITTLFLMSVLIVLANGCVCILVYRRPTLRSFTNGFVVSLAFSDILTGAVLVPLFVTFPNFMGNSYIFSIILLAGISNVCAVTYDRYVAVTIPLRYFAHINKYFLKIIVASWIVPITISMIPLAWNSDAASNVLVHRVYLFVLQFACVVVPYILVFVAYIRIFQEVHVCVKRTRSLSAVCSRTVTAHTAMKAFAEAKVARVFAIVALLFILSWIPVLYLTSVAALGRDELIPEILETLSIFTVTAGSLVNPLVYSFMKPDFKKVLRSLFRNITRSEHVMLSPSRLRPHVNGSKCNRVRVTKL